MNPLITMLKAMAVRPFHAVSKPMIQAWTRVRRSWYSFQLWRLGVPAMAGGAAGTTTGWGGAAAGAEPAGSVADSIPHTFIAEVRLKVQQGPVMRPLVNNVTLPMGQGGQWEMTELSRATAVALAEGVDLAVAEQLTDSTLQIVPTEFGAQIVLTDLARDQIGGNADLVRQVGRILGNSMVTKEDVDLLTQLDSFGVQLGAAGTSLTVGHIMAAGAAVRTGGQASGAIVAGTQEGGPDPINGVFNDNMLHSVVKNLAIGTPLTFTAGTDDANISRLVSNTPDTNVASIAGALTGVTEGAALRNAVVGRIGAVNTFSDVNLGKDASDDAKGGVFSKEAIVQVQFKGGPTMEPERDASNRATEYNIVMIKGVGEWKDEWGREMLFDAASPTS